MLDCANHTNAPFGLVSPTNTSGCLHRCGRTTVALSVESPAALAGNGPVVTLTTPPGVMQLTVALKFATGLCGGVSVGMISPVTRTERWPCRSTSPLPEVITHGAPPGLIPRSFGSCACATAALTPVIESNSTSVPPSCAETPTAAPPTRPSAPIAATKSRRNLAIPKSSTNSTANSRRYRRVLPAARFSRVGPLYLWRQKLPQEQGLLHHRPPLIQRSSLRPPRRAPSCLLAGLRWGARLQGDSKTALLAASRGASPDRSHRAARPGISEAP